MVLSIKESSLSLKNYFLSVQGFKGEDKTISALRSTLAKAGQLDGFNFVANARMAVPCPTGFTEGFQEYASILNQALIPVAEEVHKQLDLFNVELSQFISNKSVKVSVRDNHNSIKQLESWRKGKLEVLGTYFSTGSNQRQTLSKMFNNTPQIVIGAREALEAYEKAYANDPRKIQATVNTIVAKIESIISMANGDEDLDVTPESIRNIADKAFMVGRLVEMLATFCTQAETAAVLSSEILERCMDDK